MSGLSQVTAKKVLELLVGKTAFATPSVWVALCTSAPTDASTGATLVEATYTGYARKSTAGTDWNAAVAGSPSSITNANAIIFAACTGGTSSCTHFALVDSATTGAGNVLAWGALGGTVVVSTTQTPATFGAGALTATAA